MKDLRLFVTGQTTEVGWLRVDSISGEGNMTVMETYKLDDRLASFAPNDSNIAVKVALAKEFQKIPKTFTDIIEFATENSLTLVVQDQKFSTIVVGGLVISTTSPLAAGTNAIPYTDTIETTGDSSDIEFSISSGSLPTGLSLNPATGTISGTPSGTGTFTFKVKVTDNTYLASVEKEFQIVVS